MHQKKACCKSEIMADGGIVKGYASTFDREPDSYGDVIAEGAFASSLDRWRKLNDEGRFIPLLWGHDTADPVSNIGRVIEAHEDERGLFIEAEFDKDNERAQYVRKLVQEGRVYQFSFAYEVKDAATVTLADGTKANELRELELFEVSLVQIPANQHATVEEVKADTVDDKVPEEVEEKAGRRNSQKDTKELERIKDAASDILDAVKGLLTIDETTTEDGEEEAKAEAEEQAPKAEFVEAYKQAVKRYLED